MENYYECNYYGGSVDEVYGLTDYESFYYDAPQQPSYNWSELFYCQTEFVYDPAFYVIPSYQVYYPVVYSAEYHNLTYVPAYLGYYMPFYYLPSYLYYISDMYPGQVYESSSVSSSAEQNSFIYEEFDSSLYNTAFGFSKESYESFTDGVGEVTCYLYQEERPEKLNDDPNDDKENNNSSNNGVNNDVVPSTPDTHESTAVQIDDRGQPSCSTNTNPCVADDVSFLKSLSAADFMQLKAEIDGTYNQLKENLYKDVTKGYTNMKEFLKKVKWKWDRCLYTIREDEKVKKSFDMDFEYYFHDVIRIPKGRVKYEDPAEKYILYQMLGSLEMDDLKKFMELNYDNGKKKLYKKECIGHFKIKKQLNKLKWESSSLCRITDGKELRITKKAFVRHFIRGLRNITSEESKDVNYLLDVLKKSVLTPADMSDEEIEEVVNEEVTALDSELMIENPPISVFSSEKLENDVQNTPDMSISKGEEDVENEKIIEELQLVESTSCVPECSKNDPVPGEIELSFSKEDSGTEKVEDIQTFTPSEEKIEEKERPFAPSVIEMDSVFYDSFGEEDHSPVSVKRIEESLPDVPSSDRVEEVKFPPVISEPTVLAAAAEKCPNKKRFSSLRKFLSRICCCRKKPPS